MSVPAIATDQAKPSEKPATDDIVGYELTRKRVYILPTLHGLAFLCALGVMLLGSINYNNNLGFMLTFLLGSLALVAILHTYKNIAGLTVSVSHARPVFAGQNAHFTVTLDNTGGEERIQVALTYPTTKQKFETRADLAPDDITRVAVSLGTEQRGLISLPRLTVWSRFPLGLLRAWAYVDTAASVLVYPQASGEPTLPIGHGMDQANGMLIGTGNDDFSGLRDYIPGDSSRRIHWKNEARGNQTLVKQFSGATPEETSLEWVNTPGADVESKLSQLTLWILEAEREQIPYSLDLPQCSIPRSLGPDHRSQCLKVLALFGRNDG